MKVLWCLVLVIHVVSAHQGRHNGGGGGGGYGNDFGDDSDSDYNRNGGPPGGGGSPGDWYQRPPLSPEPDFGRMSLMISPARTVVASNPMKISCSAEIAPITSELYLSRISNNRLVNVAQVNTIEGTATVSSGMACRLTVEILTNGRNFVFLFNTTLTSDTGLYQCYAPRTPGSNQLFVRVVSSYDDYDDHGGHDSEENNDDVGAPQTDDSNADVGAPQNDDNNSTTIAIVVVFVSLVVAALAIVFFVLLLRYKHKKRLMVGMLPQKKKEMEAECASAPSASFYAVDKPPAYDEVIKSNEVPGFEATFGNV